MPWIPAPSGMAHTTLTGSTPPRPGPRGVAARLKGIVAITAAVVMLAGCGVRLAYNNLDRLIPWYLSDYVALDDDQRAQLDAALAEHLQWHCSTQVPLYVDWLERARRITASPGADAGALQALADEAETHVRALAATLGPDLARLLASLDDRQVETLLEAFAERIADDRETYLEPAPAERARERIARMEKRLVKWLGPLDAGQQAALTRWSDALRPSTEAWLAQREAWRQRLGEALRNRGADDSFSRAVTELIAAPDRHWPAAHRADVDYNRARTFQMLAEVHAHATPRQLAHLDREIASVSGQFTAVACSALPEAVAAINANGTPLQANSQHKSD